MAEPKGSRKPRVNRGSSITPSAYKYLIIGALRQVWSRYSPERKQVLADAKVTQTKTNKDGSISKRPDVYYTCNGCKELFKLSEIQVDHDTPVGTSPGWPPDGSGMWDRYLLSINCPESNLQVLCKPCHNIKTAQEAKERKK
jgi:5-methylcytosine-specific restriction endonuclease McrA